MTLNKRALLIQAVLSYECVAEWIIKGSFKAGARYVVELLIKTVVHACVPLIF